MSRINTNVQSLLVARGVLNSNIAPQDQALERLSTGLRINRDKDDPAGLIASETLRNTEVAIGAAIDNSRRADSVLAVAEGSLQEISSLLLELENLIDRSASEAGLSSEEIAANQLQIFAISPYLGLAGQASLGLQFVSTGSLGNGVDGFLSALGTGQTNSLDNRNDANAQRTVRAAINQVSSLRGRIGAFQKNTLQTNINSLGVALENITAAESAIRDADFAVETSALTRAQILVSSSTSALQLANAAPQNVLAPLG